MLDERRLDLDRRDPDAAHLQHVVAAAVVPEVAVRVLVVLVPGLDPRAEERLLRLVVLVPVVGHRRVAAHAEVADLARPAPGAPRRRRSRTRSRGRAGPTTPAAPRPGGSRGRCGRSRSCRCRRRSPRRSARATGGRGRRAAPRRPTRRGGATRGRTGAPRPSPPAWRRRGSGTPKKSVGRWRVSSSKTASGRRPVRVEDALGADAHREVAGVAEAVGEEELGGGVHLVGGPEAEHLLRVGLGRDHHVVVEVHGPLGAAGRARRVEPERHVVAGGRRGLERPRRPRHPVLEREVGARAPPPATSTWRRFGAPVSAGPASARSGAETTATRARLSSSKYR